MHSQKRPDESGEPLILFAHIVLLVKVREHHAFVSKET